MKNGYTQLVILSKEMGIPIRHHKKIDKEGSLGCYIPKKKRIYIKKDLKDTLEGIYILAHEIGHALDHQQKKHSTFFETEKKIVFNITNWRIVKNAEISASRRGLKVLKDIGFEFSLNKETGSVLDIILYPDSKISEELFKLWKKDYFKECKE